MNFIEKLEQCGFHGIGECSEAEIQNAEEKLGMRFPQEYRDFLKKYKAGVINGCEIMGIDTLKYLDSVANTLFLRKNDDEFPQDCFVLENIGVEGALTISNSVGQIFTYCEGKQQLICNSLSEFYDYLVSEKH